jgi:hypothetical protein
VTHGIREAADLTDGVVGGQAVRTVLNAFPARINWLPMKAASADEPIR